MSAVSCDLQEEVDHLTGGCHLHDLRRRYEADLRSEGPRAVVVTYEREAGELVVDVLPLSGSDAHQDDAVIEGVCVARLDQMTVHGYGELRDVEIDTVSPLCTDAVVLRREESLHRFWGGLDDPRLRFGHDCSCSSGGN